MKIKLIYITALALLVMGGANVLSAQAETSASTTASTTASSTIKVDTKLKVKLGDNLEKNKEIRNIKQDKKEEVKKIKKETKEYIKDLKEERKNSTTTKESKEVFKGIRKTLEKKMKRDVFEIRKNALVRELNVSYSMMLAARTRINDFIVKHDTATTTGSTTVSIMAPAKA